MDFSNNLVTPLILVAIGGVGSLVGWFIRSWKDEAIAAKQQLNEERRKNYNEILIPFVDLFSSMNSPGGIEKATKQLLDNLSRFNKNRIDLVLFGSDNVVQAHNTFWAYLYSAQTGDAKQRGEQTMRLWGRLLLEIRRDVGNKSTKLGELDMLRWLIKDMDQIERKH